MVRARICYVAIMLQLDVLFSWLSLCLPQHSNFELFSSAVMPHGVLVVAMAALGPLNRRTARANAARHAGERS
jgi:hypothetical protein